MIVHLERLRDGSRKVVQISEVSGMEEDVITMQDVFRFVRTGIDDQGRVIGRFSASGIRPRVLERLNDQGFELPAEMRALFFDQADAAR